MTSVAGHMLEQDALSLCAARTLIRSAEIAMDMLGGVPFLGGHALQYETRLTEVGVFSSVNRVEGGEDVRVTLAADVLFRFNSARLGGSAPSRLAEAVRDIRSQKPDEVTVLGYTDSKGSTGYNAGLSRRRAEAVGRALARELGGGGPELSTEGRGEANPVAANQTEGGEDNPAGRKRNRRVEIRIPKR